MKNVFGKLFILTGLFCGLSTVTACAADVFLPIEYYYGRWAKGHQVMGDITWQEDSETVDHMSYVYTSSGTRIGLLNMQDLVFISDESDRVESVTGVYVVRPINRLQVGLDRFHYVKYRKDSQRYWCVEPLDVGWSGELDVFLSVRWSNQDTIRLPDRLAPYMYLVDTVIGEQAVTINGNVSLSQRTRKREFVCVRTDRIPTFVRSESTGNNWSFGGSILWGMRDNLNVGLDLTLSVLDGEGVHGYAVVSDTLSSAGHRFSSAESFFPTYRFMILSSPTDRVFLSAEAGQGFEWGHGESSRAGLTTGGYIVDVESDTHRGFQENRTSFGVGIHYITRGDFNPMIILDDYSGFYRKMLFNRQFRTDLLLHYDKAGISSKKNSERVAVMPEIAVGLAAGFELSGRMSYSYYFSGGSYSSERVQSFLTIRWRSYAYRQESGPGWERDDPFDISYGAIPGRGQTFLSITYKPPSLSSSRNREVGFLALDGLKFSYTHTVKSNWIIGFGHKYVLAGNLNMQLNEGSSDRTNYTLSLAKRILGKLEVSVAYSQEIYGSSARNPVILSELRALL